MATPRSAAAEVLRPRRRTIRWMGTTAAITMACCVVALFASVAGAEWALATRGVSPAAIPTSTALQALAAPGAVVLAFLVAIPVVLVHAIRTRLDAVIELAGRARRVASGQRVEIPYTERADYCGDLARALRDWQEAAALREVLLRSVPVGIIGLDGQVVREANPAALATLRYAREELEGRDILELIHPGDLHLAAELTAGLTTTGLERMVVETRVRRGDGQWLWCSAVVAPVSVDAGPLHSFVAIIQDISERRREAEWAAAVQREMLPGGAPDLEGYELACSFVPAQEVGGDLYDWVQRDEGRLDLTVADVMGKGVGAALVMAALRTALRTVSADLGPADRVAMAADALTFGAAGDELFVTLFHARLEEATGVLRYVDAGHGYCVVRRADGWIERLDAHSLPLGLGLGGDYLEGEVRLLPGDMLLVCSDGLMETAEQSIRLDEVADELAGVEHAAQVVSTLVRRVSGQLADDGTVLVLHRLDAASPRSRRAGDEEPAGPEPEPMPAGRAGPPPAPPSSAPAVPAAAAEEASLWQATLHYLRTPSSGPPQLALVVLAGLVAFVEWRLGTGIPGPRGAPAGVAWAVLAAIAIGLPFIVVIAYVGAWATRNGDVPVPVLAGRARRIAAGEWAPIPYVARDDEIGDLARALRDWQDAAALREVLVESAPVGIVRVDREGVVEAANQAAQSTLGYRLDQLVGHDVTRLLHPEDMPIVAEVTDELTDSTSGTATAEVRLLCGDGRWLWTSVVVAPVTGGGGQPDSIVLILEDVSERRRQAEWAAAVQREMLPSEAPHLEGYDLAARFVPAQAVAGDLYDWVERGEGRLDLTLADVMGKGVGAALVMAALRTALRTAPAELGPAARVARAAQTMTFGPRDEGLFVTLFHATLELATGLLTYVDAGHGYCVVRRADGGVERLGERSLPLGIGTDFGEGEVVLAPGDTLVACSDGLMEISDETERLEEVLAGMDATDSAVALAGGLLDRIGTHQSDDATIVVLRRLAVGPRHDGTIRSGDARADGRDRRAPAARR